MKLIKKNVAINNTSDKKNVNLSDREEIIYRFFEKHLSEIDKKIDVNLKKDAKNHNHE